jgi:hypothetical protein
MVGFLIKGAWQAGKLAYSAAGEAKTRAEDSLDLARQLVGEVRQPQRLLEEQRHLQRAASYAIFELAARNNMLCEFGNPGSLCGRRPVVAFMVDSDNELLPLCSKHSRSVSRSRRIERVASGRNPQPGELLHRPKTSR